MKGKNSFIPKKLIKPPYYIQRSNQSIVLPKWVKVDEVKPPFYRELRTFPPKERQLFIETMLNLMWSQIKDVAGKVVGFLPPIITKILKFPPFYSYLGFMLVWFCFERIGFLKRFGLVKNGYMKKIKDQMAEKAKIYEKQYAAYLSQFSNAQIEVQSKVQQDQEKEKRLEDIIEQCERTMDLWDQKLRKKLAEVNSKAEIALKYT